MNEFFFMFLLICYASHALSASFFKVEKKELVISYVYAFYSHCVYLELFFFCVVYGKLN